MHNEYFYSQTVSGTAQFFFLTDFDLLSSEKQKKMFYFFKIL